MKVKVWGMVPAVLLCGILFVACGGSGGGGGSTGSDNGDNTVTGENSVVTAVRNSAPVSACPTGGIQVDAGFDDNGNGVLDAAEVDSTQYVCNGANGANGTNGTSGGDGFSTLVLVTNEPAGANCANGGKKVSVGLDADKDSVLDATEISSSDYICNGASGANGTDGSDGLNSLMSIIAEPAGANCAAGGLKITSGPDTDVDGVLDAGEVTITTYVCNGADGADGTNGANGNSAPIANAGPDQKVAAAGTLVPLNGTGSSDPDGNTLTYAWSITARPVGSMAALSSSTASNPTFTPDKAGAYALSLVVNDGLVNSPADTVMIRAGMPVPDTGQTRWYSTAFGDDGDYTINPMSYTDNGDGTILDNVTGLLWQKCSIGRSGLDCATGTAETYNWFQATGTYDATYNSTTTNVCGSLSLAGTGWRLPTDFELMTIVDYGIYSPAINTAYFPNTIASYYWSSTSYVANTTNAWGVGFYSGYTSLNFKTNTYYVRCVRGQ